jgi:hypothetical protein
MDDPILARALATSMLLMLTLLPCVFAALHQRNRRGHCTGIAAYLLPCIKGIGEGRTQAQKKQKKNWEDRTPTLQFTGVHPGFLCLFFSMHSFRAASTLSLVVLSRIFPLKKSLLSGDCSAPLAGSLFLPYTRGICKKKTIFS